MSWRTTYPSVATVSTATLESLTIWRNELPKPETAVQHTVHKRISGRHRMLIKERGRTARSPGRPPFNDVFGDIFK